MPCFSSARPEAFALKYAPRRPPGLIGRRFWGRLVLEVLGAVWGYFWRSLREILDLLGDCCSFLGLSKKRVFGPIFFYDSYFAANPIEFLQVPAVVDVIAGGDVGYPEAKGLGPAKCAFSMWAEKGGVG